MDEFINNDNYDSENVATMELIDLLLEGIEE